MTTPTPSPSSTAPQDQPNVQSLGYKGQVPRWTMLDTLMGGTEAVRLAGQTFLPMGPAERPASYSRRLRAAEFFNALARTVRGLAGIVFRNPAKLVESEGLNPLLLAHAEDIDGAGTHFEVFSRRVFEEALLKGHTFILVDFPAIQEPGALTKADEQSLGARPYWVHVKPEQVINWRALKQGAALYLQQVTIRENLIVPDGAFGDKMVTAYRVLQQIDGRVLWGVWREVEDASGGNRGLRLVAGGTVTNQAAIPLVPIYATAPEAPLVSLPPLLDLAYTNVAHYQIQSDHRHSLHLASVPLLVFKGRDTSQDQQVIGPETGIDVSEQGDVKYVEHAGTALGQTRQELQDLEGRMAALGLAMLQRETRAAETAEAKRIDKSEQDAHLATAARSLQDGLEQAWKFHAAYLRLTDEPEVDVCTDFENVALPPEDITAWSNLVAKGQLSLDTFWSILQEGNALPEDFDPTKEREKLEEDAELMGGPIGTTMPPVPSTDQAEGVTTLPGNVTQPPPAVRAEE